MFPHKLQPDFVPKPTGEVILQLENINYANDLVKCTHNCNSKQQHQNKSKYLKPTMQNDDNKDGGPPA